MSPYQKRLEDWRYQQIVYQVFVDRFARSKESPVTDDWLEPPKAGQLNPQEGLWDHELKHWGGNLVGLTQKLPYVQSLGVNTLYLNPIFLARTNHKYDTEDYLKIDPRFGSFEAFEALTHQAHRLGLKVILDGVFNHVGKSHPWFVDARSNPNSPYRNYFDFSDRWPRGYAAWLDIANLPELKFENPRVEREIFNGVVAHYLQWVDGWRLDLANDLGPDVLAKLNARAKSARPDSYVVGECWNYPDGWLKSLDGVLNMHLRKLILCVSNRRISPRLFQTAVTRMIVDSGIEGILRSWIPLGNHDTPRLANLLPNRADRELALFLQYTLPGAPSIFYGDRMGTSRG